VPGLVAKPIMDILLVARDSADEPSYVPALTGVSYRLVIREPDWVEHRLLKGADEVDRMLRFRDWLRTDAGDRELYAPHQTDAGPRAVAAHPALRPGQVRGGGTDTPTSVSLGSTGCTSTLSASLRRQTAELMRAVTSSDPGEQSLRRRRGGHSA